MSFNRYLIYFTVVVIVSFAIISVVSLFPFTIDDAFISLRYAKHLSDGAGFVWNIGELPVEGFSNLFWVLTEAVGFYFNLPVVILVKLVGILSLFLSMFFLYHLSRLFLSSTLSLLAASILLLHRGELLWSVSGLETTFFQSLLILVTTITLKGLADNHKNHLLLAGFFMGLLTFVRSEAVGLFILFSGLLFWYLPFSNCYKKLKQFIFPYLISVIPLFIWRYFTFDRLFPNPVYCKALFSSLPGYESFIYLKLILPFAVFFLVLFYKKYDRRYWFLLLPSFIYLIGFIHADVVVSFDNRYFLPVFALLLPLFVLSIKACVTLACGSLNESQHDRVTIFICVLMATVALPKSSIKQMQDFAATNQKAQQFRRQIANWLNENHPNAKQIALGDCGLIPYASNRAIIDTYCLNSKVMTSKELHLSYRAYVDWLLHKEKPELIILLALINQNTAYHPPFDIELYQRQRFTKDYHKIKQFKLGNNTAGYLYEVYKRN